MTVDHPCEFRERHQAVVWACIAAVAALGLATDPRAAGQVFRSPQGTAENLQFEQAAGGVITITYDLRSDDANAVYSIVLEVTSAGGAAITPSATAGDIGAGVRPGPGKRIVWSASRDVEDLQVSQFKFTIRASAGSGVPVTRAAPSTPTGRLIVTTTPEGALVYIDGQQRGATPLTLVDVAEGTHTVLVVREGYLENRRSVTISASDPTTMSVSLTAAPPAPEVQTVVAPTRPASPPPSSGGGGGRKWLWVGLAGAGAAGAGVALSARDTAPPPPPPVTCIFAVSGLSNFTVPAGGQTLTRRVSESNAPCSGGSWTASSTQQWLTVAPMSATAAADVTITAAANPGASRTASLTVAGTTVQAAQAAIPRAAVLTVVTSPNPVPPRVGSGPPCNGTDGYWTYGETVNETAGTSGTITQIWLRFLGTNPFPTNPATANDSFAANGSLQYTWNWCFTPAVSRMVQSTYSGRDANGNQFSVNGPVVVLSPR